MHTSPGGLYALSGEHYFWLLGACTLFNMEAPDSVTEKSSV